MEKNITKRQLSKAWGSAYGENFSKEYSGVYKRLPKSFSLNSLKSKWGSAYGENFSKEYPGIVKMLKPVDCRLKKNKNLVKCKKYN